MRRRAGVGAVQKQKLHQEKYKDKGSEIQEGQLQQMGRQLDALRDKLEEFAAKHRSEIKKDARFRRQFQEMCSAIGVDPLASGKGFWSVLGMGDFYYELGVQVVEVCLATTYKNGGLIGLDELRARLIAARGRDRRHQEITRDDLLVAVKKLRVFGNGFGAVAVGAGEWLVQSVPAELDADHAAALRLAADSGAAWASRETLAEGLGWDATRSEKALGHLAREGLAWIDARDDGTKRYWFPSLFAACTAA